MERNPLNLLGEYWGRKGRFFLYLTKSKSYLLDDCAFQYVLSYVLQ